MMAIGGAKLGYIVSYQKKKKLGYIDRSIVEPQKKDPKYSDWVS